MNSGSQVRLKLGKAETKLGVIGEEQTVRIAYRRGRHRGRAGPARGVSRDDRGVSNRGLL